MLTVTLAAVGVAGCAIPGQTPTPVVTPMTTAGIEQDSSGRTMVPPGFGSMRQDDLSFHLETSGLLIRALPLDESLIRLLTPDSYRAMRDLAESHRRRIDEAIRRYGLRRVSIWFVSFYGVEQDARFAPSDLTVTSVGRDFRPVDIVPLTVGWGEQRLRQRETQNALYLFDGDVELDQPVTVTYQTVQDASWEQTLQRIERERVMVRARAGRTR